MKMQSIEISSHSDKPMNEYYSKRAAEYESIYHRNDPVRQNEQEQIKDELKKMFHNKTVLEIACGTGYWTETVAPIAKEVTGIDMSSEVLEIAVQKKCKNFSKCVFLIHILCLLEAMQVSRLSASPIKKFIND